MSLFDTSGLKPALLSALSAFGKVRPTTSGAPVAAVSSSGASCAACSACCGLLLGFLRFLRFLLGLLLLLLSLLLLLLLLFQLLLELCHLVAGGSIGGLLHGGCGTVPVIAGFAASREAYDR